MSILNEQPVLSIECDEPEGKVTRHVRLMTFTPENIKEFWERSRKFHTLFSEELNDNFEKFVNRLVRKGGESGVTSTGLFWVIDDFVGMLYITDIMPGIDAHVHYSFFDRRHKGREVLLKSMLKYAFDTFKFHRLTAELPLYQVKQNFWFVEKLGFKKEGRKRSAIKYKNVWFDVNCYGLLKEDI